MYLIRTNTRVVSLKKKITVEESSELDKIESSIVSLGAPEL